MIRHIAVILLMGAFLAQTFNQGFIELSYVVNRASFEKNCENKYRPTLHCNGKCQLMKKLKEEEKKDQRNPERKQENKNEPPVSSKSFFASLQLAQIDIQREYSFSNDPSPESTYLTEIFHPPSVKFPSRG